MVLLLFFVALQAANSLYGPVADKSEEGVAPEEGGENGGEEDKQVSVSDALEAELRELRDEGRGGGGKDKQKNKTKSKERFLRLQDSRMGRGIVFVKVRDKAVDPCHLVPHMLRTAVETGDFRTRFSVRMFPLARSCYSSMEDLESTARTILTAACAEHIAARDAKVAQERAEESVAGPSDKSAPSATVPPRKIKYMIDLNRRVPLSAPLAFAPRQRMSTLFFTVQGKNEKMQRDSIMPLIGINPSTTHCVFCPRHRPPTPITPHTKPQDIRKHTHSNA